MSSQPVPNPCANEDNRPRYWGKYRGKVLNNIDPEFQGRIMAKVPAIPGSLLNYAMPCVPYAGMNVGFYAIPPIGANVWIEFEGGDPNFPVWVGCFWGPDEILHVPEPPLPEVKVFKTEYITMILNDLPGVGGFKLQCVPPAVGVPLTILCNIEGITISCPESTIEMTPASINLSIPEAEMMMDPASITITVPESVIEMQPEGISLIVPASSISMMPEAIIMETPALSVTAITSIVGETNITPVLTVEGDVSIEGFLNGTGGATIEGASLVVGLFAVAGDANVGGLLTAEGGVVILGGGVIDGLPII